MKSIKEYMGKGGDPTWTLQNTSGSQGAQNITESVATNIPNFSDACGGGNPAPNALGAPNGGCDSGAVNEGMGKGIPGSLVQRGLEKRRTKYSEKTKQSIFNGEWSITKKAFKFMAPSDFAGGGNFLAGVVKSLGGDAQYAMLSDNLGYVYMVIDIANSSPKKVTVVSYETDNYYIGNPENGAVAYKALLKDFAGRSPYSDSEIYVSGIAVKNGM